MNKLSLKSPNSQRITADLLFSFNLINGTIRCPQFLESIMKFYASTESFRFSRSFLQYLEYLEYQ